MRRCAWWLVVMVWAIAATARAGDGGSSSSSGGSSSSDGSSSDGSSSSDTGVDASSDETAACGGCEADPGTIRFDAPSDGAVVDGPFVVAVTVTPACSCASCPCTELAPEYTQLFLDTVAVGAPCFDTTCSWELNPSVDDHTLYVNAVFGVLDDQATGIDIRVASMAGSEDDGTPPPDPGPADETSSTTAPAADDDPSGCGCSSSRGEGTGTPLLAALALCVRRARRRD